MYVVVYVLVTWISFYEPLRYCLSNSEIVFALPSVLLAEASVRVVLFWSQKFNLALINTAKLQSNSEDNVHFSLCVCPQPNKMVQDFEFGTLLEKTFKMYQLCFSWTLLKMLHWQSELFWKTDQLLFHKHMQILTSEPHWRGGDHTFIVRVMPENAISSEIKWERWSERKISIFYEHFPVLPLGFPWLSASNHIPSSLIPFSKNVIGKSPLDFSIAPLASCVGSAAQSYNIKIHSFSLAHFSRTHLSVLFHWYSEKSYSCAVHSSCRWLLVCLSLCRFGCILIYHCFVCRESRPCPLFLLATCCFTFRP